MLLTDTVIPPGGRLDQFPRLGWVHYLGHGVGDVLRDPSLPPSVAVTRQKRAGIGQSLAIYVVQAVAAHHLRTTEYREQQHDHLWRRMPSPAPSTLKIVVLGLGIIGETITRRLSEFGYTVYGWTRSARQMEGVRCIAGLSELRTLLPTFDYVIGALPETEHTVELINRDTIGLMKPGAYIINVGRGSLIVETDLLDGV